MWLRGAPVRILAASLGVLLLTACWDPSSSEDGHNTVELGHAFDCTNVARSKPTVASGADSEATCVRGGDRMILDTWRTREIAKQAAGSSVIGCALAERLNARKIWLVQHVNWSAATRSHLAAELLHETWRSDIRAVAC